MNRRSVIGNSAYSPTCRKFVLVLPTSSEALVVLKQRKACFLWISFVFFSFLLLFIFYFLLNHYFSFIVTPLQIYI